MGISVAITMELDGFTLDVAWEIGDELAVLFGRSGSGKSLTLRSIAGLAVPDAGTISLGGRTLFCGRDRRGLPPQQRSIGFVFQDLALFPHMSVRQNILYGGHGLCRSERERSALEMIDRFGLSGVSQKRPGEISGGQRQRAAFARALVRRPGALLLDEPFSALDGPLRGEMRMFLRDLQRELAVPVVMVTHDRAEAFTLADRLIIYGNGRVLQSGPPEEVAACPRSAEVARLVLQEPDRAGAQRRMHAEDRAGRAGAAAEAAYARSLVPA